MMIILFYHLKLQHHSLNMIQKNHPLPGQRARMLFFTDHHKYPKRHYKKNIKKMQTEFWGLCRETQLCGSKRSDNLVSQVLNIALKILRYRTEWRTPCARNFLMLQSSIMYWICQNLTQSPLIYQYHLGHLIKSVYCQNKTPRETKCTDVV